MRAWWESWWMAVLAFAFIGVVAFYSLRSAYREDRRGPNCYESPSSADVGRTLVPAVHAHGGLYTCGLYSRTALPDVIRCYELTKGCSP